MSYLKTRKEKNYVKHIKMLDLENMEISIHILLHFLDIKHALNGNFNSNFTIQDQY